MLRVGSVLTALAQLSSIGGSFIEEELQNTKRKLEPESSHRENLLTFPDKT